VRIDFSGYSEARKNSQDIQALTTFPEAFGDFRFDHSGNITIWN